LIQTLLVEWHTRQEGSISLIIRQDKVELTLMKEERGAAAAIMADGEHLAEDPNKYWRLKKALEDSWLLIYYDLTNEIELTWTFVDKH